MGSFFDRGAGLAVEDGGDPDFVTADFGFEVGKAEASSFSVIGGMVMVQILLSTS